MSKTLRKMLKVVLIWTVVFLLTFDTAMACRFFARRRARRCCYRPPACYYMPTEKVETADDMAPPQPEKAEDVSPAPRVDEAPAEIRPLQTPEPVEPSPANPAPARATE